MYYSFSMLQMEEPLGKLTEREIEEMNPQTLQLYEKMRWKRRGAISGAGVVIAALLIFTLSGPAMAPWKQERQGLANLRQATHERRIVVEEARGELAAAQAQADAIRTMGEAARAYPEYRSQIYIEALTEALSNGTIGQLVFVPEGGALPITESQRSLK